MTQFLSYAIPGLPYGCVFALMAVGLVLTYQTSGVFNLAYGAQAYASALIFYVCVHAGWPNWAAFVTVVVLAAPALGLAMDRFLYRFIRSAPVLVKLVSALGMLIAIPSASSAHLRRPAAPGATVALAAAGICLFSPGGRCHQRHRAVDGRGDPCGSALGLIDVTFHPDRPEDAGDGREPEDGRARRYQFRTCGRGHLGHVELPRRPRRGLAGALVRRFAVFELHRPARGRHRRSRAREPHESAFGLLGGIGLGVVQELLGGYLPSGSVLSSGLRPGLPFVVLIGLLLALPGLRERWFHDDPLAACDPPPPPMARTIGGYGFEGAMRIVRWAVIVAFFVSCLTWVPGNWTFTLTQGLAYSIVFLSIVLLTGMSGQISLCQASFAGVGAFSCAQLASHFGISVLLESWREASSRPSSVLWSRFRRCDSAGLR